MEKSASREVIRVIAKDPSPSSQGRRPRSIPSLYHTTTTTTSSSSSSPPAIPQALFVAASSSSVRPPAQPSSRSSASSSLAPNSASSSTPSAPPFPILPTIPNPSSTSDSFSFVFTSSAPSSSPSLSPTSLPSTSTSRTLSRGSKIGIGIALGFLVLLMGSAAFLLFYNRRRRGGRKDTDGERGREGRSYADTGIRTERSLFSTANSRAHLTSSANHIGTGWTTATKPDVETPTSTYKSPGVESHITEPESICESPRNDLVYEKYHAKAERKSRSRSNSRTKPTTSGTTTTATKSVLDRFLHPNSPRKSPPSSEESHSYPLRDFAVPPTPIRLLDVPKGNGNGDLFAQQQQEHLSRQQHQGDEPLGNNRRILWPHGVDSYPAQNGTSDDKAKDKEKEKEQEIERERRDSRVRFDSS